MPLPRPNQGESQDDFISRCMSDADIVGEFPDKDQRLAVCRSQFLKGKDNEEDREKGMTLERKYFALEIKATDDDDDDEDKGVVTAVFAQMNVVDRGGDVILSGAFGEQEVVVSTYDHGSSLPFRGDLPVGKGRIFEKGDEAIAELQFFLNTKSGREHFEVIKALGGLQEYSFGFLVTETGELTEDLVKMGVDRVIKKVDVFEVSPVLLGEGLNTRTLTVKRRKEKKTEPSEAEIKAAEAEVKAAEEVEKEFKKNVVAEFERFKQQSRY